MPKVFISYRRWDTSGETTHIYEKRGVAHQAQPCKGAIPACPVFSDWGGGHNRPCIPLTGGLHNSDFLRDVIL